LGPNAFDFQQDCFSTPVYFFFFLFFFSNLLREQCSFLPPPERPHSPLPLVSFPPKPFFTRRHRCSKGIPPEVFRTFLLRGPLPKMVGRSHHPTPPPDFPCVVQFAFPFTGLPTSGLPPLVPPQNPHAPLTRSLTVVHPHNPIVFPHPKPSTQLLPRRRTQPSCLRALS